MLIIVGYAIYVMQIVLALIYRNIGRIRLDMPKFLLINPAGETFNLRVEMRADATVSAHVP